MPIVMRPNIILSAANLMISVALVVLLTTFTCAEVESNQAQDPAAPVVNQTKPHEITKMVSVVNSDGKNRYILKGRHQRVLPERTSILDLSIDPNIKFPPKQISRVIGVSLGAYNLTAAVRGVQAGIYNVVYGNSVLIQAGAMNKIDGNFSGGQFALIGSEVYGKLRGIQVGLIYNLYDNSQKHNGYGIQAGLINLSEPEFYGIQAGLIDFNVQLFNGVQLGALNIAGSLHGTQMGIVNYAGNFKSGGGECFGLQLGLINSCDGALKGVQIGLFNTAASNALPWSIGLNAGF